VSRQKQKGEASLIDFGLDGGITRGDPAVFDELDAVIDGVPSFKMFTAYEQGLSNEYINDVFQQLAERDAVAVMHTEDQSVTDGLTQQLQEQNRYDSKWYPSYRPSTPNRCPQTTRCEWLEILV